LRKPGNRNRRQIEQVHEIRVETEIGIEAERVRCNRSFLVDRAGGRQEQHIDRPECESASRFSGTSSYWARQASSAL
jgi:hypothetical protein